MLSIKKTNVKQVKALRNAVVSCQMSETTNENSPKVQVNSIILVSKTLREAYEAEKKVRERPPVLPDSVVLHFGGDSALERTKQSTFSSSEYFSKLNATKLGRTLLLASTLPSTQTFLSE